MAEEAKDEELSAAVAVLTQTTAEMELQQAVVDAKRAEQQQEEETVAPPSPPPRTVSTSSEAGSGQRGRPPGSVDKNYEARKAAGTPSQNDLKHDLKIAEQELGKVNERVHSFITRLPVLTRSLLCVRAQVKVERDAAHAERDAAITKFNEVRAACVCGCAGVRVFIHPFTRLVSCHMLRSSRRKCARCLTATRRTATRRTVTRRTVTRRTDS